MVDKSMFCVTSAASVGCTFVDWSIHWLSGQSQTYVVDERQWHAICQDPLLNQPAITAHGHKKNHPSGFEDARMYVQTIQHTTGRGGRSIYPCPLHFDVCCAKLGIDQHDCKDGQIFKKVLEYEKKDYQDMLSWLITKQDIPCVFVALDPNVQGYTWNVRSHSPRARASPHNDQMIFFKDSMSAWQELGLTDVWDQRERMALNIRPFDSHPYNDFDIPHNHLWINCQDLWFDTERTLQHIMHWLDLPLQDQRRDLWLPIMRRWQTVHNDCLKFYRMLPKIVRAIVNNMPFALPNLSLYQEAIIQHCLIYQHGLNLKTWQLLKFPNNTVDLHKLLEPNIHSID